MSDRCGIDVQPNALLDALSDYGADEVTAPEEPEAPVPNAAALDAVRAELERQREHGAPGLYLDLDDDAAAVIDGEVNLYELAAALTTPAAAEGSDFYTARLAAWEQVTAQMMATMEQLRADALAAIPTPEEVRAAAERYQAAYAMRRPSGHAHLQAYQGGQPIDPPQRPRYPVGGTGPTGEYIAPAQVTPPPPAPPMPQHQWEELGDSPNDLLRVYCQRCEIPLVPKSAEARGSWRGYDWKAHHAQNTPCIPTDPRES